MQYTIRNIPKRVDQALRKKAKAEGKSLNEATIEALAAALGVNGAPVEHHDLDWIFGTWREDPAFDEAIKEFDRIEPEMWK